MMNFETEFAHKYPQRAYLIRYMRAAIGKDEINWCDLTSTNLTDYVEYLKKTVSANSVSNYCAFLKSFLNMVSDEVDLPTLKYAKILRVKKDPQQNVALNEEEVQRIDEYYQNLLKQEGHSREKDVLCLFLIECYAGARGVDVELMKPSNFSNGMITYVSKKTHNLAVVPEHHRLKELFKRKPKRTLSRTTKNRIIKDVCKKCGRDEKVTIFYRGSMKTKRKYEFIGFHSARRSFASILSAKGVPVPEISQYMSHSNISMTERYIKVDTNRVSPEAMSFFKK